MDMKTVRRLFALLLAVLLLRPAVTVFAAPDSTAADTICRMLSYYVYHGAKAQTDIARLNEELAESDPALADAWEDIMDYWIWADQEMEVTPDILPDGLPDDDSLCIVVLGYALNSTGTMKDELVGRLEVALASAVKYPNAYILCTGGGTASRNSKKTEAGQMAIWLKKHGIDESRIIIEDESLSTVQNAQFSCRILAQDYPEVRHIALITSDYHVPRGCLFFNTQLALNACDSGSEPPDIVGNAGYQTGRGYTEDLSSYYMEIAQMAGIDFESSGKPALSKVVRLEIDGAFTYETGTAMALTATAVYDTGFTRDVTADAVFSGVDMTQTGEQLLTVTYAENGIEVTARLLVDVTSGYAEEYTQEITEETTADTAQVPAPAEPLAAGTSGSSRAPVWLFILLAALLALLALLLRIKIRFNSKN